MSDQTSTQENNQDVSKVGFFAWAWSVGDAAINAMKMPFIKAAIKRQFQSAYGQISEEIMDKQEKLRHERLKVKNTSDSNLKYDLNRALELQDEITTSQKIQTYIKAEYLAMFAKDFVPQSDIDD